MLQNGRMVLATRLSAYYGTMKLLRACCWGLANDHLSSVSRDLTVYRRHSCASSHDRSRLCFALLKTHEVEGKSGRAPQKI